MKKHILLVTDEAKTEALAREVLSDYDLDASSGEAAEKAAAIKSSDLIIIDFDLKAADGLQILRQLRRLAPGTPLIMLSHSNDVPLAVSATKLGVAAFLRKPVEADLLKQAVQKNIPALKGLPLRPARTAWLRGESQALRNFYRSLGEVIGRPNIILAGEPGIDKLAVVEYLHENGAKSGRRLKAIDLSAFRKENLETMFWNSIQGLAAEPRPGTILNEEDRYGTLFLANINTVEENFRRSIFDYFQERKGKIDPEVTIVIGSGPAPQPVRDFAVLEVPPLRQRKEDLPRLLQHYLRFYSEQHNRRIAGIAPELLAILTEYEYPGNYRELECLVEQAVLRSTSAVITLGEISLNSGNLYEIVQGECLFSGEAELEAAKQTFEKLLYRILLAKNGGDAAAAARFLDIPRTALAERLELLGSRPLN